MPLSVPDNKIIYVDDHSIERDEGNEHFEYCQYVLFLVCPTLATVLQTCFCYLPQVASVNLRINYPTPSSTNEIITHKVSSW